MGINVDWAAEWAEHFVQRSNPGSSSYWSKRSTEFGKHSGHSVYKDVFLEYLDIAPDKTVMDMGCGSGNLCVPLAKAGHRVLAADFSDGMLAEASRKAQEEDVADLITFKKLDWAEDWQLAGVEPKSADIVIASRSTIVQDLGDAFTKMATVAREQVCITLATDDGPKNYRDIFSYLGRPPLKQPDFIFAVNLLLQWGFDPELRYIDSQKKDRFSSREDARGYYREYINDLAGDELELLEKYLDEHLIEDDSDCEYRYALDKTRLVRWAFISWKPNDVATARW